MTTRAHDTPFWRSKAGLVLLVFLGLAGVLLAAEHWAHLVGTLPLLLPVLICIVMHLFMHNGHGHGGHGHGPEQKP